VQHGVGSRAVNEILNKDMQSIIAGRFALFFEGLKYVTGCRK